MTLGSLSYLGQINLALNLSSAYAGAEVHPFRPLATKRRHDQCVMWLALKPGLIQWMAIPIGLVRYHELLWVLFQFLEDFGQRVGASAF